ncbi:MAG: methyltransferase [Hyphomicrobiaceae bacterium]
MRGRAGDGPLRLMQDCLGLLGALRRPLVVGEASGALAAALRAHGAEPADWLREASARSSSPPRAWPEGSGFDAAMIRLPKAKDGLTMALHAAAAKTLPGSAIAVFGANDEGIRSVAPKLSEVADAVGTLDSRHHARVVIGRRRPDIDGLKGRLEDWRRVGQIELRGSSRSWVSYPGTFAQGGLDAGTAFLLGCLPPIPPGSRVLDFAAGTGVIAGFIAARDPDSNIEMIEADALAMAAARENVPRARCRLGTNLAAADARDYDLMVSNPPIHDGVTENHAVLEGLIADAPAYLRDGGRLLLVVQRRVAVQPLLLKAFTSARTIADNGRFTVVSAVRGQHG